MRTGFLHGNDRVGLLGQRRSGHDPDTLTRSDFRARRLAGCDRSKDLQQIRADLADVYGPVPAEVEKLLDMTEARTLAGKAGIESIVLIKGDIVFTVRDMTAARQVFDGASGTVRMPDNNTVHWRLSPPYLEMPTLLRIVLKQLRQAAREV